MSKTDASAAAAAKTNPGLIGRLFAKGFSAMSPAERKEVLADSVITAGISEYTAKAHELMDGKHSDIDQIQDLWDDGPDAMPKHQQVAGHSGSHAGDTTITGPGQSASGNGAAKMSKEYSKPAPQGGAQATTEMLGEMLTMKSAMKAVLKALDGYSRQAELLSSAVTALVDENAAMKATIKAIRKAESEKEDDKEGSSGHETEEEEADEEAEESESGSGTEIEIVNEMDEEDEAESDEDDDGRKKAAKSRVMAKARVKLAKGRLAKALDAETDGKPKAAARHVGVAKAHIAKAKELFVTAKAQGPKATDRLAVLEKAIRAVAKACKSPAENQDKWPAATEKHAGGAAKAADVAAVATTVAPDLAQIQQTVKSMQEQFEEANRGLGMFKTTIAGFMNAVGGQSRGSGTPPVVLAKGGKDVASGEAAVRAKITELETSGMITRRDAETAEDVLGQVIAISKGFALDPQIPRTRISRMPEPLQQVFSEAA